MTYFSNASLFAPRLLRIIAHITSFNKHRYFCLFIKVDLATDIAAEPTALPITTPSSTDSTAFWVTAFGINVNIDMAVLESAYQNDQSLLPFAA